MSMLLAALAGGGQAYSQMAEQKQHENAIANFEQMRQQAELEKEKRIEEAQVRSEQRGDARYAARRESDMQFGIEKAPLLAEAKLNAQKQEDQYKDSRFNEDLNQTAQLAQAKHIVDPFELEKSQAMTEHIRAQTESIKNPPRELAKVPEQVKLFLDNTRKDIELLEAKTADLTAYKEGADDPRYKLDLDDLKKKKDAYEKTISKMDIVASEGVSESGNGDTNPLEIDTIDVPASLRKERVEGYKEIHNSLGKKAADSVVSVDDATFNAMLEKAKNTPGADAGVEKTPTSEDKKAGEGSSLMGQAKQAKQDPARQAKEIDMYLKYGASGQGVQADTINNIVRSNMSDSEKRELIAKVMQNDPGIITEIGNFLRKALN